MYYKIVSVHEDCPEDPVVQYGEFTLNTTALRVNPIGNHQILQVLAAVYGIKDPNISAVLSLREWSGGEAENWASDLADAPCTDSDRFMVGEWVYHVEISDEPFQQLPAGVTAACFSQAELADRDVRAHVIIRMTKAGDIRAIGPASQSACEEKVKAVASPIGTADPIFWFDNATGDTVYQIVPLNALDG